MQENAPAPSGDIFTEAFAGYNVPDRLVTLGDYYPVVQVMDAAGALRYVREGGESGYSAASLSRMRQAVRWTKWINALNTGRKWALTRLFERLDPMLEAGIAVAVVPSHDPFNDATAVRALAQRLCEDGQRIDATSCLVRHTKIKRIVFGGPSYRGLHLQTIAIANESLVAGQSVLLLDDIAKSGASLRACRELLYRAGARRVQATALGRVVG